MPSTIIASIPQPAFSSVLDIGITFTAFCDFLDASGVTQHVRATVPRDSTFLALAGATGSAKLRLYNIVGPLLGFTPNVIT